MDEKTILSIQLYETIPFQKNFFQVYPIKFLRNPHFQCNSRCLKKFRVFEGFSRLFSRGTNCASVLIARKHRICLYEQKKFSQK